MTHLMIDLETLGTGMTAPIIEIGAVRFDREGITSEFSAHVDFDSCLALGARADGDTIKWWLKQSEAARANVTEDGMSISVAMRAFLTWVLEGGKPETVWSNGANFDIPLVDQWARRLKLSVPYEFWRARDTRTFFEAIGWKPPKSQTAHQAVLDAKKQALDVIEGWKRVKQ